MTDKDYSGKLFEEFPPVSSREWEEKIAEDLKGADYEKKLIWKTAEGIKVNPYYRAEDLKAVSYLGTLPGENSYLRNQQLKDNTWEVRQCIKTPDVAEANRIAAEALSKGATALSLNAKEVRNTAHLEKLLEGISPVHTDIHYYGARNYKVLLNRLVEHCKNRGSDPAKLRGSFDFDPISFVLLRGDFYQSLEGDMDDLADFLEYGSHVAPGMRLISVNGHYFHNSGANSVQELALSMASASDYIARLANADQAVNIILPRITFIMAAGSNYFFEIAKFRAARLLWARIAAQYHPAPKPEGLTAHLQAVTSNYNKTVYDPFVNLLRSTTEAMSAAIAGADSITVFPYDAPFFDSNEFSTRIARNQQILLKEESYLDKVIDPSAGSYYIESLTHSMAEHAWDMFVKIEQMGGMLEVVKAGFVQDEIEKNNIQRQQDLANRRMILLGTNQYPNPEERMLNKIQEEVEEETQETVPTKYKTLKLGRMADAFEDLRLSTELHAEAGNKTPVVFLLTIGNLAMRKARAAFATGFFGCAGYTILDHPGFSSVQEGVEAVVDENPDIVVICSSDDEYPLLVPDICSLLKKSQSNSLIVVAGYPEDHIEAFRQAGVNEFVHIRSNLVETLSNFHQSLGISMI